jgi:sulfopyruvate decarboxylase TPP-binding subunit
MLLDAIRTVGIGTIVTVPDTHQRTLLTAITDSGDPRLITCATEDEATAVAAGLWIGGEEPALLIQHAGLYASVNTLRGVAIDGHIPMFYLIGLLSREPDKQPRESTRSMVKYSMPLLETFGVPYALIDGPHDVPAVAEMFHTSRERRGPAAVLIGLPTS